MEDDKAPKMGISGTVVEADAAVRGDIEALPSGTNQAGVKRDLKRRHINMIALAGMIV